MEFYTKPDAVACITGAEQVPSLWGRVEFYQRQDRVLVVARLSGLPKTQTDFFALHIHGGSDCTGEGFPDTGGHYNPGSQQHPLHAGDLPPLLSCAGKAFLAVETDRFRLSQVLGRTVVIHDSPDDFRTQPAGNAGSKIGCGVICRV